MAPTDRVVNLRCDPAADARQFATPPGLSLAELAVGIGVARERARLLVEPFLAVGVVVELEDGRLVVADPLVVEAFEDWEGGP